MSIVFAYTGEPALSIGVGVVEVLSKMILYYGHERAWARIKLGANSQSEKPVKSPGNEGEVIEEQPVSVPHYGAS